MSFSLANISINCESNDEKVQYDLLDAPVMRSVMLAGPCPTSHPWENTGTHFYQQPTSQPAKKTSSESQIDFSNLSYIVTSSSTPLPAAPAYLEPHSCFHSPSNPQVLMSALEQVFAASHVDYQLNTPKLRVKCITYGAGAVHFRVSFYQSSTARVLVEFQRRRGCVVTFNRLYHTVLSQLGSHVQNCSQTSPPVPPPRTALPEPDQQDVLRSLELLMGMATMPQVDIQREACQGLVHLSSLSVFPQTIAQIDLAPVVSVLATLMQSKEDDIVHSTAAFMHNCLGAKSDSFEQALVHTVVPTLFQHLNTQPLNYLNKDTYRLLSACVLALCDKHSCSFAVYRDVLSGFKQCGDERIMSNVVSSLNLINSC